MTTPEGWREGARVKTCVLGRVGGGRVGREEGPGLLTSPFGTGSLFGSLCSPTIAITDTASCALLATDFAPASVCLDSLVPKETKVYLLDLPSSRMPETGGKVAGSRGVAAIRCSHEGKVLPRAGLETPPRDFFSWSPFLLGATPQQAVCSGSCSSFRSWHSLIALPAATLPPRARSAFS